MSAIAPLRALPLPAPRPARPQAARPAQRPKLVVVPAPTAGRVPFVIAVAGVLAVGLFALLLLHTLAAQDAFTVHKLQRQSAELSDQEQALAIGNEQARAPSNLAARAAGLGMIPATSLTVTRLHGRPAALLYAPVPPPPAPVATPSPTATSKPATAKAKPKPKPSPSHH